MQEVWHFLAYAGGIAAALLIIAAFVTLLRAMGFKLPLDIVTLLDEVIARRRQGRVKLAVNVVFVDREGKAVNLSHLVTVEMHNGAGGVNELKGGFFRGCDPEVIKASARVQVDFQEGLFKEDLTVQLDNEHETLVIKSRYTVAEIISRINRDTPVYGT